jgi:hypothetical protein
MYTGNSPKCLPEECHMLGIGWVVTLGMGQESGVREVIAQGHVQPALSGIFV